MFIKLKPRVSSVSQACEININERNNFVYKIPTLLWAIDPHYLKSVDFVLGESSQSSKSLKSKS